MFRWVLVVTICLFSSLSALAEWSYDAVEDKMGGGKVFTAELRSTNTLRFGYLYEGGQKATLLLRKHPRYGIEAILSVPRGQFMCSAGGHNCMVLISFDGGRPTSYTVALPSDYSTNALFVRGAPSLVRFLHFRLRFSVATSHAFPPRASYSARCASVTRSRIMAVCASSGGRAGRPRGFFCVALVIGTPHVFAQRERFPSVQPLVALRAGVGRAARAVAVLAVHRVWCLRPAARHVPQVRLTVAAWRAGPRLRSAALTNSPHFPISRKYIIDRVFGVHRLLPLSLIVLLVWHNN